MNYNPVGMTQRMELRSGGQRDVFRELRMSICNPQHLPMNRRTMLQASSIGLLGLGMNHVDALRAADVVSQSAGGGTAKSVIFVFLSGGLTQHDSFDPIAGLF